MHPGQHRARQKFSHGAKNEISSVIPFYRLPFFTDGGRAKEDVVSHPVSE